MGIVPGGSVISSVHVSDRQVWSARVVVFSTLEETRHHLHGRIDSGLLPEEDLILPACIAISSVYGKTMTVKAQKGQAFIFAVIVLLAIVLVLALLPMRSARTRLTPAVQQVFWQVNGKNSTTGFVTEEIEAHVMIEAADEYFGSVEIKVRKDMSYWFDSDFNVKTFPADLIGGQATEFEVAFVPDEASGDRLRGYFVEIDFLLLNTKWVMENSYPPRLSVTQSVQGSTAAA